MKHVSGIIPWAFLCLALTFISSAQATPLQKNTDLSLSAPGLTVALEGIGLEELGSGTANISVEIVGEVEKAFLYWAGRDFPCPEVGGVCTIPEPYKDQELIFDGVPILGEVLGSEQNQFVSGLMNNVGYRADVTAIVQGRGTGLQSFTIEDGNLDSNFAASFNGAALLVISRDPTDPAVYDVIVFEGLDFAWADAFEPEALVTTPVTLDYPAADVARSAELTIVVGDAEPQRPDRVDISDNPSAVDQLDGSAGLSWDVDNIPIVIEAGVTSTTVEVVSPPMAPREGREPTSLSRVRSDPYLRRGGTTRPDSLLWELAVLRLPLFLECIPGELCDDGDACTVGDVCDETGQCVGTPIDPEVDCADDNLCTIDTCDPAIGCVNTPDDTRCDDGIACTTNACVPDDPNADADGCVFTPDDGTCDDATACTTDVCLPDDPGADADGCVHLPDDTQCDDAIACTVGACVPDDPGAGADGCVFAPDDALCGDSVTCTTDACLPNDPNADADGCVYTPDDSGCVDAFACTNEACIPDDPGADADGCVVTPDDSLCEDGLGCTVGACLPDNPNADADGCVVTPDNTQCDDAFACTANACLPEDPNADADGCVFTPDDAACDDAAVCTTDACIPDAPGADADGCVFTPDDGACDDATTCTTDACIPGDPNADADGCVFAPDDAACDDAIACTANDCVPGDPDADADGCVFTPRDVLCGDGFACTNDLCVPSDPSAGPDGCVSTPDDTFCDDRSVCTIDLCDPFDPNAASNGCVFETITCDDVTDCPAGATDCIDGFCFCGQTPVVPTVTEWGLVVMALLGLVAGTIVFGRRSSRDACRAA